MQCVMRVSSQGKGRKQRAVVLMLAAADRAHVRETRLEGVVTPCSRAWEGQEGVDGGGLVRMCVWISVVAPAGRWAGIPRAIVAFTAHGMHHSTFSALSVAAPTTSQPCRAVRQGQSVPLRVLEGWWPDEAR